MKTRIILIVLAIAFCSLPVVAQAKKAKVGVTVNVTDGDAELKSKIENRLTRLLQKSDKMEVVSKRNGDYYFEVTLIKIFSKEDPKLRYAVSWELTHWVKCQNDYIYESLKNGMTVTDTDGLFKSLDRWVERVSRDDDVRSLVRRNSEHL